MNAIRPVTWVLEPGVFSSGHEKLLAAIQECGHKAVLWTDDWWTNRKWPLLPDQGVIFRGSLENAARIPRDLPWRPGAFCNVAAFHCSAWYPRAAKWLFNQPWRDMPAEELVNNPAAATAKLGVPQTVFVRPDSPLKPFSGRVVATDNLTLEALDYGFYFEDRRLPVIVAPVQKIQREWRFVVVNDDVVAGSAYSADGRQGAGAINSGPAWEVAQEIASQLVPPENVYVMDICESNGRLRLLELNPFSGADLYDCSAEAVAQAVSSFVSSFPLT